MDCPQCRRSWPDGTAQCPACGYSLAGTPPQDRPKQNRNTVLIIVIAAIALGVAPVVIIIVLAILAGIWYMIYGTPP